MQDGDADDGVEAGLHPELRQASNPAGMAARQLRQKSRARRDCGGARVHGGDTCRRMRQERQVPSSATSDVEHPGSWTDRSSQDEVEQVDVGTDEGRPGLRKLHEPSLRLLALLPVAAAVPAMAMAWRTALTGTWLRSLPIQEAALGSEAWTEGIKHDGSRP